MFKRVISMLKACKKRVNTLFKPKMKTLIVDADLRGRRFKKYPISVDGRHIEIKTSGRKFSPLFSNETTLKIPVPWWKIWQFTSEVNVVINGAGKCINFKTGEVQGPVESDVLKAAENKILENIGREKVEVPFVMYIILGAVILLALKVFGMM